MRITSLDGGRSVDVEATVDTGAFLTMLPARTLRELGVEPTGSRRFLIADGSSVAWRSGRRGPRLTARASRPSWRSARTDAPPLLGRYTLDGLGLAVDPVKQRLVPARLIML